MILFLFCFIISIAPLCSPCHSAADDFSQESSSLIEINPDYQSAKFKIIKAPKKIDKFNYVMSSFPSQEAITSIVGYLNGRLPFKPHFPELTSSEAVKYLPRDLLTLNSVGYDSPDLKEHVLSSEFFGINLESDYLLSYWTSCIDFIKNIPNKHELLTTADFARIILNNNRIDLFIGISPPQAKKAYAIATTYWENEYKCFGWVFNCSLEKVLQQLPFIHSKDDFFNLFNNYSLFFPCSCPSALREFWQHNDYGFLTKKDIYELNGAANKLLNITNDGDFIIAFGNTPSLIGRILKQKIAKHAINREVIILPFSGAPNRSRAGLLDKPTHADLTTYERAKYFSNVILPMFNLTPANKKLKGKTIHIVDLIISGSGPTYFIDAFVLSFLAKKSFKRLRKKHIPTIKIVALNAIHKQWQHELDPGSYRDLLRDRRLISDVYMGDGTLYLPSTIKPHYRLPLAEIPLACLVKLDAPENHERILVKFNPRLWQPEYVDYLNIDNNPHINTSYSQLYLEYFDSVVAPLI